MQSSGSSRSVDAIPQHRSFKLGDGKRLGWLCQRLAWSATCLKEPCLRRSCGEFTRSLPPKRPLLCPSTSYIVQLALNFPCFSVYLHLPQLPAHYSPNLRLPLRTFDRSCEGRTQGHGHEIRRTLALYQSSMWLRGC